MQDEEVEKAMLYYLIFENEQYSLDEDDFVNNRNKKIIRAINELKAEDKEISALTIKSKIRANGKQVLEYISTLGEYIRITSVESIYNTLMQLSKKRKLIKLLQEKMIGLSDCEDIDVELEELIKQATSIEKITEKQKNFTEQVFDTLKAIEDNYLKRNDYSLYTGITDLDSKILGLHNQEFTVIGARPGVGKTTLALQIAQNIARKGKKVTIMSLEMSDTQIIQKMIAKESNINSYRMRRGTLEEGDFDKIRDASQAITELPITLISQANTIQKIENIIRKLKNKDNVDLVIIDYLQLIKNGKRFNSREQEVADITRTLKLLTIELNIPIIALCQLNRNANKTEPTLADLRESGSIEQDADNVWFLYQEKESDASVVDITLKVAKQRAGEVGKVYLKFNKPQSEFIGTIHM